MKKRINNYTFNSATRTITLTGITVQLDALLLITNLTDNIIIFNFADETKKATVTGSDIVLQFDTTAMSNTDELQIFYDDATSYPLTDSELRATAIPVTTNGLTNSELRNQAVTVNGSVSTSNGLTDTQLRATPIPISGTVNTTGLTDAQLRASDIKVTLDGETVPVTGTFYQATQPVSGPLTNTELRATAVPISGSVTTGGLTNTELRASDVKVSLDGEVVSTTGLTDAQIRATPLPISGSVTTNGLTDAQLRAADVKITLDGESVAVTGTFYPPTQPISGALTDTELRATPVPVSTGGLTDTQLRAADVKVSLDNEVVNTSDAALLTQMQTLNTNDATFMLRCLVSVMSDPVYLNKTLNGLNAILLSGSTTAVTGTLTGVTTVSTVSNMAAVGGKNSDMMTNDLSQAAWNGLRILLT